MNHRILIPLTLLLALGLVGACSGCRNQEDPVQATERITPPTAPPSSPLERLIPIEATEELLDAWYSHLIPAPTDIPQKCQPEDPKEVTARLRRDFESQLARLILEEVGGEEALDGLAEAMEPAREHVLEFLYLKTLEGGIEVSEEDIRRAFEENQDRFARQEAAHFHFFFDEFSEGSTNDAPPESLQGLLAMGREGASMAAIRREAVMQGIVYSERPSRVVRGTLPPLLEAAIFSAPVGEFSDIRRTENGWHLIQLNSIQPAQDADLEHATPILRDQLRHEKTMALRGEVRDHLRGGDEGLDSGDLDDRERDLVISLYRQGTDTLERALAMVHNNHVINSFHAAVFGGGGMEFTEEELRDYFEEHREGFVRRTHYHVLEAQVPLHPSDADVSTPWLEQQARVERRREIMEWIDRLTREGRSFLELEQGEAGFPVRILDRESMPQGPRGAMLDLAVENLEVGEYSLAMPGRQFFHVYQLIGREDPAPMDFEQARPLAERGLLYRHLEEQYAAVACRAMETAIGRMKDE